MAIDNFIPEVWSARLLANLHKTQVFAQAGVMNRDYEGEIRNGGDVVRINAIGPVTVTAHTKNTDITAAETLTDAQTALTIDTSYHFNFQIDDIDAAQQTPKVVDAAMKEAAYGLSNTQDPLLAALHSQIAADNWYGTNAVPKTGFTAANVYEYLVEMKIILDNNNCPIEGRFGIIPPFVEGYLLKDDRFVKSGVDTVALMNGEVGRAAGFRLLTSNNISKTSATSAYKCIFGVPSAWTLAEQIMKIEAYRPPLRFADAVKGLHLYGYKVIRPTNLAVLCISTT